MAVEKAAVLARSRHRRSLECSCSGHDGKGLPDDQASGKFRRFCEYFAWPVEGLPASDDTKDNRVVITPAKNNDGDFGERSAWERANGPFTTADEFDWELYDQGGGWNVRASAWQQGINVRGRREDGADDHALATQTRSLCGKARAAQCAPGRNRLVANLRPVRYRLMRQLPPV
jgi:hypothetical protein